MSGELLASIGKGGGAVIMGLELERNDAVVSWIGCECGSGSSTLLCNLNDFTRET